MISIGFVFKPSFSAMARKLLINIISGSIKVKII